MAQIGIDGLCDRERISNASLRWLVVLYIPFGALLLLVRVAALFAIGGAARLLPSSQRRRLFPLFLTVYGFRRRWRGNGLFIAQPAMPMVIAYNHVSLYDAFILFELPHVAIISSDPQKNASRVNAAVMGWVARSFSTDVRIITGGRDFVQMLKAWRQSPAPPRLCIAPEGTVGNGKGLFAFEKGFFGIGAQVLPVTFKAAAALPISLHPVLAHHGLNYVWPLMLPWVTYEMEALPVTSIRSDETPQAFAERVQLAMAQHLHIPATRVTRGDKATYRAALKASRRRVSAPGLSG